MLSKLSALLIIAVALLRAATPVYSYKVVHSYPHDPNAFTQGLVYLDGYLYEGTGRFGESSIRKVKLETGEVIQKHDIPPTYFGEGIVTWGKKLIELTYQSNIGYVYDLATFEPKDTFQYSGEGWGLTHDGKRIIMSDGTAELRFWDPNTLKEQNRLKVSDGGEPVVNLNELEYVRGEIYANVWLTDRIARINPSTGHVSSWIDLTGLLSESERTSRDAVLNGIAYDAAHDRLFVTGKLWPKLFEIKVVPKPSGGSTRGQAPRPRDASPRGPAPAS